MRHAIQINDFKDQKWSLYCEHAAFTLSNTIQLQTDSFTPPPVGGALLSGQSGFHGLWALHDRHERGHRRLVGVRGEHRLQLRAHLLHQRAREVNQLSANLEGELRGGEEWNGKKCGEIIVQQTAEKGATKKGEICVMNGKK
jgi:hypothetical protein